MKLFVSVAVGIAFVVSCALAEQCTVDGDCALSTCSAGHMVVCQHPDGAGVVTDGGLCTCSDTTSPQCTMKEHCYGDLTTLTCPDAQRHCYDNRCICSRFPGGGR